MNVESLKDYVSSLFNQIKSGQIKPIDINLIPIFKKFQELNLSTPEIQNNIEYFIKTLDTFLNAEEIFRLKIDQIKEFIQKLDDKSIIVQFLQRFANDENILEKLVNKSMNIPFTLDNITSNYLTDSFNRWTKPRSICIHEEFTEPPKTEKLDSSNFQNETFNFDVVKEIEKYYFEIKSKLPCSLNDIIIQHENIEEAFMHFTYILHLIQDKKIKILSNKNEIILNLN